MRISVSPKRIGLWLLAGALTIYAASFLFAYLRYFHGHDHVLGFARLFRLRPESTVPTWYSSFLLLACAFVLSLIHLAKRRARDPFRHHWLLLAILFLFLSVDETAQIHETIGDLAAKKASGLLGGFAPAWTAVYGPLVALFAVFYFRFLRHLPRRTAILFVLSGFLHVGGAPGVALLSGQVATRFSIPTASPMRCSTRRRKCPRCSGPSCPITHSCHTSRSPSTGWRFRSSGCRDRDLATRRGANRPVRSRRSI